jgi:5-methylcytosine-specific restriction endonuclease McrA
MSARIPLVKAPVLRRLPSSKVPRRRTHAPAATARPRIDHDTRLLVWNRDGGRCRNCGSTVELQFDHVIPVALGGANTAENIELLCRTCNLAKSARLAAPAPRRDGEGKAL